MYIESGVDKYLLNGFILSFCSCASANYQHKTQQSLTAIQLLPISLSLIQIDIHSITLFNGVYSVSLSFFLQSLCMPITRIDDMVNKKKPQQPMQQQRNYCQSGSICKKKSLCIIGYLLGFMEIVTFNFKFYNTLMTIISNSYTCTL